MHMQSIHAHSFMRARWFCLLLGLLLLPMPGGRAAAADPASHPAFVLQKDGTYRYTGQDEPPMLEHLRLSRNRLILAFLLLLLAGILFSIWFLALIGGAFLFLLTLGQAGNANPDSGLAILLFVSLMVLAFHLFVFLRELSHRRDLRWRIYSMPEGPAKEAYQQMFSRQKSLFDLILTFDISLGIMLLLMLGAWLSER